MDIIDDGTVARIGRDLKKCGYSKQIKLEAAQAEELVERLQKLPGLVKAVYLSEGANLVVDPLRWMSDAAAWRRFLSDVADDGHLTPERCGLSRADA